MRISEIRTTIVNIPLEAPYLWSLGAYAGKSSVIVEVLTSDGIVGIGEAPTHKCEPIIREHMAPKLLGADSFDIEQCERLCVPETRALAHADSNLSLQAFGGIEMALWDLRGKAWGLPLYKLLGGAVRKQIPFTEYYSYRLKKMGSAEKAHQAK